MALNTWGANHSFFYLFCQPYWVMIQFWNVIFTLCCIRYMCRMFGRFKLHFSGRFWNQMYLWHLIESCIKPAHWKPPKNIEAAVSFCEQNKNCIGNSRLAFLNKSLQTTTCVVSFWKVHDFQHFNKLLGSGVERESFPTEASHHSSLTAALTIVSSCFWASSPPQRWKRLGKNIGDGRKDWDFLIQWVDCIESTHCIKKLSWTAKWKTGKDTKIFQWLELRTVPCSIRGHEWRWISNRKQT